MLNPGDTIVGNTLGATTAPGPASLDCFILQAPAAPPGIYRHRVTLATAGAPGHLGTLRGRVVSSSPPPDVQLQATTSPSTSPLQWYGLGQSERILFRVTGSAATPDNYAASMESTPVTATDLGAFPGGFLVITTLGQGHTSDTDVWVYDASLVPIPGFGNDQEPAPGTSSHARLARDFTSAGVYYLAIAGYDLANNREKAPDERRTTSTFAILDFPGGTLSSSTTPAQNLSFVIVDNTGASHPVAAASAEPYHVLWFRFSLAPPALGACCRPDGTCSDGGSSGYCASLGGTYQGDGSTCPITCPQPPAGACCFADGSCSHIDSFLCAVAGIAWNGAGSLCSQVVCTPSRSCYPNCDGSTQPPVANVADFTCFFQRFAAQDPYTNCDASTTSPVFNVADYTCFLQRFAAGCP